MSILTMDWLFPSFHKGIFMLLCGLVAGIVGLIAILRQHERSWLVWLAVLPMLWGIFMVLGECLVPLFIPGTAH
jgi:hypothetical protein